jgi:hypothetical protein
MFRCATLLSWFGLCAIWGLARAPSTLAALRACGCLADFLYGGQKQTNQDGNDGNHDQQLDQGESGSLAQHLI